MRGFIKNFIRWYYFQNGTLDGLEDTEFGNEITKEINSHKKLSREEILCRALGYQKDSNLTALDRFTQSKEIAENLNNNRFWDSKAKELGVNRTSKVVEYFEELKVLGPGVISTSLITCDYTFKGFYSFILKCKDLVDIFCEGAQYLDSALIGPNGKSLSYKDFASLFPNKTYKCFKEILSQIEIKPNRIIPFRKVGKVITFTNDYLEVPKSYIQDMSNDFVCECLLYAFLIRADKINPIYFGQAEALCAKLNNPFCLSDLDVTNLISIANSSGLTVRELASCFEIVLPKWEDCIEKTNGLYKLCYAKDVDDNIVKIIYYEPANAVGSTIVPVGTALEDFVYIINNGVSISYSEGVPYVNGSPLVLDWGK